MYLIGIDVGTTNTKSVIFDTEVGQVRATGNCRTITRHPRAEWSEFEADELWNTVVQSLRQAVVQCDRPERIRAIAVASMGESGFPLDAKRNVLYPAIAWHDSRTAPQTQWWNDTIGRKQLYDITGQVLNPIFGINKLLWLHSNIPIVFQRIHHWLSIEDFVLWKLSGEIVTDYSIASRTMVFDQRAHTWSETLLKHAGIPIAWFPPAFPSGTPVGPLRKGITGELGLPQHTTVVTGGHDHLCAALAAGVTQPGQLLDSTGTAGVILLLSNTFQPADDLLTAGCTSYAYVLPDTYVTLGSINFAGGALEWIINLLYGQDTQSAIPEETYARALHEAAQVPIGSRGISILPYFLGTGTPHGKDSARAHILGLTPSHNQPELVRALMEGLGFWLRENLEVFNRIGIVQPDSEIIAVGGATRAKELMQIKANITGCRIKVPQITEAAATGAALLAGIGIDAFPSVDEAVASVTHIEEIYMPDQEATAEYSNIYQQRYKPAHQSIFGD